LKINDRSKWFCNPGPGCGYFANQGGAALPTDVAVVPPPFTLGTAPRMLPNLRLPGTNTAALSVFKEIKLHEGWQLQFRAETFNAFNYPQFGNVQTTVNTSNFGQITKQINNPREVQLALKLYF